MVGCNGRKTQVFCRCRTSFLCSVVLSFVLCPPKSVWFYHIGQRTFFGVLLVLVAFPPEVANQSRREKRIALSRRDIAVRSLQKQCSHEGATVSRCYYARMDEVVRLKSRFVSSRPGDGPTAGCTVGVRRIERLLKRSLVDEGRLKIATAEELGRLGPHFAMYSSVLALASTDDQGPF